MKGKGRSLNETQTQPGGFLLARADNTWDAREVHAFGVKSLRKAATPQNENSKIVGLYRRFYLGIGAAKGF
jgi:hypothetical protein